uniref:Uncharacterized protein n=1 Tax=Acrobeloides nanus TaxID=290746 RepID=A0A914C0U8_9BILA
MQYKIRIIDVNPSLSYDLTSIQSRIRKETDDYWKCLNESLKFQSSYVLLLEDDAVPVDGFFMMMQSLMIQLDQRPYIDYVKLYHPRILRKIPSLVQTISILVVLSYGVHRLWRRSAVTFSVSVCSYLLIRLVFIDLFADFRYHVTKSAYLSLPESCCTPAVLFQSNKIPEMVSELSKIPSNLGHAKDHILDESSFIGRATDMNLIVHIGGFSSIRNKFVHVEINDNSFIDRVFTYLRLSIFYKKRIH